GPTGYGDSPYACYSAFAGNTLLVSPEKLVEDGLLGKKDLASIHPAAGERVNYAAVHKSKELMLHQALEAFRKTTDTKLRSAFESFRQRYSSWLPDYALFQALKDAYEGVAWNEWDPRLVRREPAALSAARDKLREKIESEEFGQFLFFKQWFALKDYCSERGIKFIGDIPIFVAHDSADVWTNPFQFKLDNDGKPIVIAGVPPDYFSA